MKPRFFRRSLVAALVTLCSPLLADANPAVPFQDPPSQSADANPDQIPVVQSREPAVTATPPSAIHDQTTQFPFPGRQGSVSTPEKGQQGVQDALRHSSRGLRALEAGAREEAKGELETTLDIMSKIPEEVASDGRYLQLMEEVATLKAGVSAPSRDGANEEGRQEAQERQEQEDSADTEEVPGLVDAEEDPARDLTESEPGLAEEPEEVRYDIPIVRNEKVDAYIQFFKTKKRDVISRAFARAGRYLPMVREIFQEQGLPLDLVNLAYIESAFKYRAFSRAKAAGIWQFIKSTGLRYGLGVNYWLDERRDPEKATLAAAKYLKDLYDQFNSWELALAGYNAGEKRVQRAIDRQGTRDFWSLKLPKETQLFVPAIMAITIIAKQPEKHGFTPPVEEAWEIDQATVPGSIHLHSIARAINVSPHVIRDLNPALTRGVTPVMASQHSINLPPGTRPLLLANIDELPRYRPRYPKTRVAGDRYRVRPGDTLGKIASRHRTTVGLIARLNGMRVQDTLRAGVLLRLPKGGQSIRPVVAASSAPGSTGPRPSSVRAPASSQPPVHVVRRGDTIWGIAKAYAVTPEELRQWNDLRHKAKIHPGQTLRVIDRSDGRSGRTRPRSSATVKTVGYRVKRGDTLWGISRAHDVTVDDLRDWNGLTHRAKLRVGQRLKIHLDRT